MAAATIFAAIWTDNMLGPLHLTKSDAAAAIETAQSIREKGESAGLVQLVRAVRLDPDDTLTVLDGPEFDA